LRNNTTDRVKVSNARKHASGECQGVGKTESNQSRGESLGHQSDESSSTANQSRAPTDANSYPAIQIEEGLVAAIVNISPFERETGNIRYAKVVDPLEVFVHEPVLACESSNGNYSIDRISKVRHQG
jgi:dihydroxyacid dehydratase/phosphogluconate dehydratase